MDLSAHTKGSGGLEKSFLANMNAGRMAQKIQKLKPVKASDNPRTPQKPEQYRKLNPVKVAIHQRGSKKVKAKLGSFPTSLPSPSVGNQGQSSSFMGE